ncbi:MAG: chloride channel protein [Thiolinea sp.]
MLFINKNQQGSAVYRITVLLIMACFLGVVVSFLAIAFVECVFWLNNILFIAPHSRIQIQDSWVLPTLTLLVPTAGGLLVGYLFQKLSPTHHVLGPVDSIYAVQLRRELPNWRSGLISTGASILSLGCGASVGQYGPMVYLGSMMGDLVAKLQFRIPNLNSIAIACGVAAAISTAFNAPIAGLIFAHEVILRHYSLQSFAPTTVAAATGYVVANVVFDRPPLFLVQFDGVAHSHEFLLFGLLGFSCALLATGFMHLVLASGKVSSKLRLAPMFHPAIAGLIVGLVALVLPEVLGTGRETLRFAIVEGAFESKELFMLVTAKMALTALCIGFGFAGGVFSPALLIGILFGALSWSVLEIMGVPNSGVVVYAICGMMAFNTAVIGAPLTTILIVYELTRNYDLTIAAMVSVVFANLLAFRIFGRSLFDVQLARRGIDLSLGRDRVILEHTPVSQYMINDYLKFAPDTAVTTAIQTIKASKHTEAVILDNKQFLGITTIQSLLQQDEENRADSSICSSWPRFNESTSVWQAMRSLNDFAGNGIPVVNADNQLLGIVTEADLIKAYMEIAHGIRREENAVV